MQEVGDAQVFAQAAHLFPGVIHVRRDDQGLAFVVQLFQYLERPLGQSKPIPVELELDGLQSLRPVPVPDAQHFQHRTRDFPQTGRIVTAMQALPVEARITLGTHPLANQPAG